MQSTGCSVCKQDKTDVQDYRNELAIEMQLLLAYPQLRDLDGDGPLEVCRQCLENSKQQVPARRVISPDTTVDSQNIPTQRTDTQRSDTENISSEAIVQPPIIVQIPKNPEEIRARFPNDPMKRYKVTQLLKQAMPTTVRKRKFEEIVNADEGSESQQEARVKELRQEEFRKYIFRNQNANRSRSNRSASSSDSSVPSFSESFPHPPVILPPRAATQGGVRTPIEMQVNRRRPLTDSLSSSDSNEAQAANSPDRAQLSPVRALSPDFVDRRPRNPQPKDQRVPNTARSTRSSSRSSNDGSAHSNMAAPSRPTIPYPVNAPRNARVPPKGTSGA